MGGWWEPAAALTCTSLFTASGELHKPCDIFKISEIEVQKLPKGLLPRPGTVSSSAPSFPHWDWRDPDGKFWRCFPDGRVEPR